MKKLFCIIIALMCGLTAFSQSASQVLNDALANIRKGKGITCDFVLTANGQNISGTLKSVGNKFSIQTPAGSTWYDSKNMWTSNYSTKEITLVNPTSSEIQEANPLSYLQSNSTDYVIAFSKHKIAGQYIVILNPKKKNTGIKAVEISIGQSSKLPSRIRIRDSRDNISSLKISKLNLNATIPNSAFVCPVSSLKGYELVDLR